MRTTRHLLLLTLCAAASASTLPGQRTVPAPDAAQLLASWDLEKVHLAVELANRLERGGRSNVIVTLEPTRDAQGLAHLREPGELATLCAEVRQRTDSVLAGVLGPDMPLVGRLDSTPLFAVEADAASLQRLLAHPLVRSVEPELTYEPLDYEGPMVSSVNLAARLQGGPDTFDDITGAGVAIAVVDDGVDYDHPWLGGGGFPNAKTIGGYDFADDDSDPRGPRTHGTSCAGVAAGPFDPSSNPDPAAWNTGVAPGAKIYALKVSSDSGPGFPSWAVDQALDWCTTHQYDDPANPIRVVNMSLGPTCTTFDTPQTGALNTLVQTLNALGIVVVAAAGNNADPTGVAYNAACPNIIAVGAVWDQTSTVQDGFILCGTVVTDFPVVRGITVYSNCGTLLDVFAPANYAFAPLNGGGFYSDFGGTSAAAAYVSGVAALLVEYGRKVGVDPTADQIRSALRTSQSPIVDPRTSISKPLLDWESAMLLGMPKALVEVRATGPDMPVVDLPSSGILLQGHEHGTPAIPFHHIDQAVDLTLDGARIRVDVPSAPWTDPWILPLDPGKTITWEAVGGDLVLDHPTTYTAG